MVKALDRVPQQFAMRASKLVCPVQARRAFGNLLPAYRSNRPVAMRTHPMGALLTE